MLKLSTSTPDAELSGCSAFERLSSSIFRPGKFLLAGCDGAYCWWNYAGEMSTLPVFVLILSDFLQRSFEQNHELAFRFMDASTA